MPEQNAVQLAKQLQKQQQKLRLRELYLENIERQIQSEQNNTGRFRRIT